MRSSNKRSRSKSNRPKPLGNIVNRVFDSSGPEGKVRGTPQQIIDKYLLLARDAQLSGDRVAAENFLQHAEHYTRMLSEAQRELAREAEVRQQQSNNHNRRFDGRDDSESPSEPAETVEAESGERHNENANRRGNRRDDRRGPRPHRDATDPRESQQPRDESESMLVETPESRSVTQPEQRMDADNAVTHAEPTSRPQRAKASAPVEAAPSEPASGDTAVTEAAPVESGDAPKPRKLRAASATRRAPRKPKADGPSDTAQVAE